MFALAKPAAQHTKNNTYRTHPRGISLTAQRNKARSAQLLNSFPNRLRYSSLSKVAVDDQPTKAIKKRKSA